MKNFNLLILFFACLLASCNGYEPIKPYIYETNPSYTKGYAEFYGNYYYTQNGNINNTLSLSLFTDSLRINDKYELEDGFGQYLFIEDIFVSPTDSLLPVGTYTLNETGDPFTVFPGRKDTIDSKIYTLGTCIDYYEKKTSKSTSKLITSGSFTVSISEDTVYTIVCNFKTADNIQLKGSFTGKLPSFDRSLTTQKSLIPRRIHFQKP